MFLRGTFDWIGTYPDFLHVGDYKTAVNTYLEKTFTPAHREMSESLNRSQYEQLVRAIAERAQEARSEVRALIDQGPFQPEDALRVGLVDELAYEDELDDLVDELRRRRLHRRRGLRRGVVGSDRRARAASKIAVINAVGVINSGSSGFDPVNGAVIGSDSLVEYIREARADRSIRAIVLRVDSPGGSSTASDVIWRELSISRENDRPVIVSMSDLAASGGYYIALGGDVIVAQPGTLTGSIGVYTGKFVTSGTLDKLGANIESDQQRQARRDLFAGSPVHAGGADEGRGVDAGRLRPVRRAHRRGAPHDAREGRRDRAGPRVDRRAGQADRPGRRARRALQGDRSRQAARAHSRRRGSASWWSIRRAAASTKCWPTNCQSPVGRVAQPPTRPTR